MAKVSIIIAVYNTEEYIERCARSLFEQSLDDIEYLFINDCTQDRSIDILRETIKDYPQRAGQAKIIDMAHNSGQAAVRKCGIEAASGDYIIHCDSDDWVDRDMYRQMYEKAEAEGLDMVICGFNEVWEETDEKKTNSEPYSHDLTGAILFSQWGGVLWNKLVRRDIARNKSILYPHGDHWEDLTLATQYSLLCKSFAFIEKPLYYYLHRESSTLGISGSTIDKFLKNTTAAAENYDIIVSYLDKYEVGAKYEDITIRRQLYLKNQLLKVPPFKGLTRQYRITCKAVNRKILKSKIINVKEKINFCIAMSGFYPLLFTFKKKKDSGLCQKSA